MQNIFEKNGKVLYLFLFIISVCMVSYDFLNTPNVWVDEGVFTEVARNISVHQVIGIQTEPGQFFPMNNFLLSTGYPVIMPVSLSFSLFGLGLWQARLPMVLYMLLLLFVTYLLVKKIAGEKNAIISVLLILSFAPFYGNGRPVQGEVPGIALLLTALIALFNLEQVNFKSVKLALLAGFLFGLSASVKPIFLLGIIASLFISLILFYKRDGYIKSVYWMAIGAILPLVLWVKIHLSTWEAIKNFIPNIIYFSGNHGESVSVWYVVTHNALRFLTESTPILFLVLMSIVAFGYYIKIKKEGTGNISISESTLSVFALLNILAYLKGTGWYRYFFPAQILILILIPISFLYIKKYIGNKQYAFVAYIPLLLSVVLCIHLIFLSDTSFVATRLRNRTLATTLEQIDVSKTFLFYNTIESRVFFKGDNYYQYVALGDFLKAGDQDIFKKIEPDYILSDTDNVSLQKCYTYMPVSRYYLYTKNNQCK